MTRQWQCFMVFLSKIYWTRSLCKSNQINQEIYLHKCDTSHLYVWHKALLLRKLAAHLSLSVLTPRNIFFSESNPAANIRAVYGGLRSTKMRQANRDIVLCGTTDISALWSPGIVSMTTKSMGDSDERPIWNMSTSLSGSYWTMIACPRLSVNDTECWLLFWINCKTDRTVTSGWGVHDQLH